MNPTRGVASSLALAAGLAAQSIAASVSAVVPITVQLTTALGSNQATQAAGPLGTTGSVWAYVGLDEATAGWQVLGHPGETSVRLVHYLVAFNGPATASATQHEFLIAFTSVGGTVPGVITIERESGVTAGVTAPSVAIDHDDNGGIDLLDPQTITL